MRAAPWTCGVISVCCIGLMILPNGNAVWIPANELGERAALDKNYIRRPFRRRAYPVCQTSVDVVEHNNLNDDCLSFTKPH